VVRDALLVNGIKFTLVYPDKSIKDEYIQRYIDRGNNETFVNLLENNWDDWISDMEKQKGCKHIKLQSGQYLSDVVKL
jgi:thioesterase domain-containing protein